jgi:hypothetical protein
MSLSRTLLMTSVCFSLVACAVEEPVEGVEVPGAEPVDVGLDDGRASNLLPADEPGRRDRRRMDVDQLDATIKLVTGGLFWEAGGDNQFEELAATLGKPDYLNSTFEDLSTSLLFQKFLGDAAHSVCTELAQVDPLRLEPDRTLLVHVASTDTVESNPEGVEANLVGLLLRYHGRTLEPGSDQLNPWRWLFESSTYVSSDPLAGWRAVCVGLMTHPDFYTY